MCTIPGQTGRTPMAFRRTSAAVSSHLVEFHGGRGGGNDIPPKQKKNFTKTSPNHTLWGYGLRLIAFKRQRLRPWPSGRRREFVRPYVRRRLVRPPYRTGGEFRVSLCERVYCGWCLSCGNRALYLLGRTVSVSRQLVEVLPFQSGWIPHVHALSRFHARGYPMTLVFLACDVEMLFMYPWAVVVWAWREGAVRWG